MEDLKDIMALPKPDSSAKKIYEWQELVAQIAEQSGLSFGHCLQLWIKGGYSELRLVLTEFRESPNKNKAKFVNWRLQKYAQDKINILDSQRPV